MGEQLNHLLYVGRIEKVTVTGSRLHDGYRGHLIKSRAKETTIAYSLVDDGLDGQASYEIDLPNGGAATIVGNVVGQAPQTGNPVVISFGSEGSPWPESRLQLAHNTLVNRGVKPARFLRVYRDRLPPDAEVLAVNNLTVGLGVLTLGVLPTGIRSRFEGNYPALPSMLLDADLLGHELAPGSILRGRGVDPRAFEGRDLSPKAEFTLPVGTQPLTPPAHWTPGAFQRWGARRNRAAGTPLTRLRWHQ